MDDLRSLDSDAAGAQGKRGWKIDVLLAIAVLCITGPIIQVWNAQTAPRYLLTVAMTDDHSLRLDPYVGVLGMDRAVYDGHTYSDKAPYPSLLAVPPYAAFKAVGGEPFPVVDGRQVVNRSTHVGLWWLTLWESTLPAIALLIVLRRMLLRVEPRHATAVALAIVLGTTMLPFTSWLFSHVMAALWVGLAWALLRPRPAAARPLLWAGVFLGLGIGTEYTGALIALILLVDTLLTRRWMSALWLSAGTVAATIPLLAYNWLTFRNPFEVSYQGHLASFHGSGAFGVFNLTVPQVTEVSRALVGSRGLFILTPVALLAVAGCVVAVLSGERRRDGCIGLIALVGYLVATTGIDGLGGDSPGPRYLVPMFPLLAVPLSLVWRRLPAASAAAAVAGAAIMWIATVTYPSIDSKAPNTLATWIDLLLRGDLVANLLTGRHNGWILFVTGGLGIIAIAGALRISRDQLRASAT